MWEVVWTDPDKESRREHRERKAMQKEQKDKNRAARSSTSTRSLSPTDSKSFGFFGSKSLKRSTTPKPESSAPTLASSTHESKARRVSYLSSAPSAAASTTTASEPLGTPVNKSSTAGFLTDHFADSLRESPESSTRGLIDSVFSKWTDSSLHPGSPCNTSMTDSTIKTAHYVQTLGPSSFITKDTEVTVAPRTRDDDIAGVISEVKISADVAKEEPPTPPQSPAMSAHSPLKVDTPISLFPGQFSPPSKTPLVRVPSWTSKFKPNNPDAWKPPDAWDCAPSPEARASTFEDILEDPMEVEEDMTLSLNLNGMQREVKRMAAASPQIRLIRLTESWGVSDDAKLYKELEMEKKRWMLSSLDNLDKPVDLDPTKHVPWKITAAKAKKVLALYESQATTSYLAAIHYTKNVYHMSPAPLSHQLFPNIHPVTVPAISPSTFPVAPGLFGAVYSLSLPSLVPSPDVPGILKSVHRCLSMGGTFHLTLIDPLPSTVTLGPLLRAWLDEHLLFNLERNFRCMNPSKLFPIWLADASLRAEGSTITTVKFLAVPSRGHGPDGAVAEGQRRSEKLVKQELRSLVGRMLWMDVWSGFIAADSWWWEDDAIVQECHQMRTSWEYCVIEAVKDG